MKIKMFKPISVLLCLAMLISLIPMTAFADASKAVKITDESKAEKITEEVISEELKPEKITEETTSEKVSEETTAEKSSAEADSAKITKDSDSEKITEEAIFISLDEAKEIALKDAGLDRNKQKITFTKEILSRNKGRPCYLLDFYTGENQYHYEIDAKTGEVIYGRKYILLTEAKKIALDDAGCTEKVAFTDEELVDGGIKTPYYLLVFSDTKTRWTYRINAVSGDILGKKVETIVAADLISLEKAKSIALKDAGLVENAEKIVFTKEELIRNQGKPYYLLEFYTGKYQYHYEIDAKTGDIIYGRRYILLADAKRIAVDDAECSDKVTFLEEELIDGGIKTPYYLLVFADNETQWTYRINAISGSVMGKHIENIGEADFISLEEAKKIALKGAGLDEYAQKIVFTKTELNRNQGKPYYLLEFYTGKYQYHYEIDAKTGDIIYGRRYILLSDAKKIAVDDAGCTERVTFLEEELVDGGIKTPYYRLVFADRKTQWTYRINAVSGDILEKKHKDISEPAYISLEEAKKIALKDAGLDKYAQKIVFTKAELIRSLNSPCYLFEFYTGKNQYHYEIDAKTGEIIYGRKYILLSDAKKIAVDDAGCTDRVTFLEEELVDGGIKTPYYHLVFADNRTQWTYRINAVTGSVLKKKQKDIQVKPDIEWENPFGDVKKKDWFYFSVKFAYDFGLMKGTTEMEFSPDSFVTRAMFVMILYRMEKEPQAGDSVFVDVEIGGYYGKAIAWANANGIVSGVSKDRFAPNDPITREQMATILYRYADFKGYDVESNGNTAYTDSASISGYARNAVSWAAANMLMKGNDDGSFLPNANTTRAQAAAVFTRMIENLE